MSHNTVAARIRHWFDKLAFPESYREQFLRALDTISISDNVSIAAYDLQETDGQRNLLSFLAMCDSLAAFYAEKGIPEQILLDSLSDIPRWTKVWSELEGTLCLRELGWLKYTMEGCLFKLGRLQFRMGGAPEDAPELGVRKDDPVLEVHIPKDGPLTAESCDDSFARAREFFARYFPEFDYRYFTCGSWLLASELREMLPESSNILAFQKRFAVLREFPSDAILRFSLRWGMTREGVADFVCPNDFTREVKRRALAGEEFHVAYGIIPK